jgi:hypothetical protein
VVVGWDEECIVRRRKREEVSKSVEKTKKR